MDGVIFNLCCVLLQLYLLKFVDSQRALSVACSPLRCAALLAAGLFAFCLLLTAILRICAGLPRNNNELFLN